MKYYKILDTDFYQITMSAAYLYNGIANRRTGFEGFIRNIKSKVNPSNDQFYIFDGETEIREYIETIKKEIKDPYFIDTFIELVEPAITSPNKLEIVKKIKTEWNKIDKDFDYMVVPNGTKVFPMVPVFQFSGSVMIGQLIETMITNIYNGRTGLATLQYLTDNDKLTMISGEELDFLVRLMNNEQFAIDEYTEILNDTAKEFRESTDSILLEAAFRRCPSKETADIASITAINNGWDGTSNVGIYMKHWTDRQKIGGSQAHAFIMSFENERDAFIAWDKIFPGTTMLIDTYDVINAAEMIFEMVRDGIITAPADVRIDSDPLDEYAEEVDKIFNEYFNGKRVSRIDGGKKIGIFVSGDMDIPVYDDFEFRNIPCSKSMAGTKFVYSDSRVERLNCGFVYKIVEYTNKDGKIIRPEKKATGKSNYPGLKHSVYDSKTNTLTVDCSTDAMGYYRINETNKDTKIIFNK